MDSVDNNKEESDDFEMRMSGDNFFSNLQKEEKEIILEKEEKERNEENENEEQVWKKKSKKEKQSNKTNQTKRGKYIV